VTSRTMRGVANIRADMNC